MRIQVLPLPAVTVGAFTETPFVLVIDDMDSEAVAQSFEGLKESVGAKAVLIYDGLLDVGSPLELTDDQRDEIAARIDGALALTQ